MTQACKSLLILSLLAAAPAAAQVAGRVNFQGRLTDPGDGTPLDGSFDMSFRICDSLAGACSGGALLWSEGPKTLSVDNGVFETLLGDSIALSSAVFSAAGRYLEIEVEGETLSPRQELVSAPMALRAAAAESLEPGDGDYIQVRATLQAGATFYVSSGTVDTDLLVGGQMRSVGNVRVQGLLIAGSGAQQLTSAAGLIDAAKLDPATLLPNASIDTSSVVKRNAQGRVDNFLLDASSITKQGNVFNGALQLARLSASALLPNAAVDTSSIVKRNAQGGVDNFMLDAASVTKQGNSFNAAGLLLRYDGVAALSITSTSSVRIATNVVVTGRLARENAFIMLRDSGGETINAGFADLTWDNAIVSDAMYAVSLPDATVAVDRAGLYRVSYNVMSEHTGNTRSATECRLTVGGADVAHSHGVGYHRDGTPDAILGRANANMTTLLSLAAGDTVAVQCELGAGQDTTTIANQSWILLEFLR